MAKISMGRAARAFALIAISCNQSFADNTHTSTPFLVQATPTLASTLDGTTLLQEFAAAYQQGPIDGLLSGRRRGKTKEAKTIPSAVVGSAGISDCPAGYENIITVSECQTAAALSYLTDNTPHDESVNGDKRPKGCFTWKDGKEAFFNPHPGAPSHVDNAFKPICKQKGQLVSPTALQPTNVKAKLKDVVQRGTEPASDDRSLSSKDAGRSNVWKAVLGSAGASGCPAGYENIITVSECQTAAALSYLTDNTPHDESVNGDKRPKGCFTWKGGQEAFFNPHAGTPSQVDNAFKPICKQQGALAPPTPPQPGNRKYSVFTTWGFWNSEEMPSANRTHLCAQAKQLNMMNIAIWSPKQVVQLASKNSDLQTLWPKIPRHVAQTDLSRYMIAHERGGIYMDVDVAAYHPLPAGDWKVLLLTEYEDVTPTGPRENKAYHLRISNAFFASEPGHSFWRMAIDEAVRRCNILLQEGSTEWTNADILYATGPDVVTSIYHQHFKTDPEVILMPKEFALNQKANSWYKNADLVYRPNEATSVLQRDDCTFHQ